MALRLVAILSTVSLIFTGCEQVNKEKPPAKENTPAPQVMQKRIDWNGLKDEDPEIRKKACGRLFALCRELHGWSWPQKGDPEAVAALIVMLKDADENVRYEAGTWLLNIEEKTMIPKLIEGIKSPDPLFRFETIHMLGRIGHGASGDATPAIPQLTEALADPLERIRVTAAWTLSRLLVEDPKILEVLTAGLESDERPVIKTAFDGLKEYVAFGTRFLAAKKPAKLTGVLVGFLNNDDPRFRVSAAYTLGRCGDKSEPVLAALTAALGDSHEKVTIASAFAFSHLEPPNPPQQVFVVLSKEMDAERGGYHRKLVIWALGRLNQFPTCVVESLTRHLEDPDPEDRLEAACLLVRHPGNDTVKLERVLIECTRLSGPLFTGRLKAIEALGKLGLVSAESRKAIEEASRDPSDSVREAAERILAKKRGGQKP